jgi:hypothetical protein
MAKCDDESPPGWLGVLLPLCMTANDNMSAQLQVSVIRPVIWSTLLVKQQRELLDTCCRIAVVLPKL